MPSANVAGQLQLSPAAGTVLNAGAAQTLTATFTPADPINYDGGVVTHDDQGREGDASDQCHRRILHL